MSRRSGSAYTFDLEPDDPDDLVELDGSEGPGPADRAPSWADRIRARLVRVERRTWAITGGVVAGAVVVAGAGVAVAGTVTERQRTDRLVAAPGGVLDAATVDPEQPVWSIDTDDGVLAVLPGGVVVTRQGADVLAVDVATGAERWRRTLGVQVECGPGPVDPAEAALPVDQVVCLAGDLTDRTVTVLSPDGKIQHARDLGDVSDLVVAPAAGGELVVVERTGALPEPQDFAHEDEAHRALAEGRVAGPGVTLRFEDAATGDVRASVEADFDPERTADLCLVGNGDDPAGSVGIDVEGYSLRSSPRLVSYQRCGIDVAWVPPSVVPGSVADVGGREQMWDDWLWSVDGGLVVRARAGDEVRADPEDPVSLSGRLLDPQATDGTPGPRIVAGDGGIEAVDPQDLRRTLWTRPWGTAYGSQGWTGGDLASSSAVLARTEHVVVVRYPDGVMVGLDPSDGTELWQVPDSGGWSNATGTDGRRLVLLVSDDQGRTTVRTVDLETGEVAEGAEPGALGALPVAVAGHVVARVVDPAPEEADGTSATVLGEDGILRTPGSLQGWGGA